MEKCARCKGKFPGPGIEKEGKVYCCDKCARGVRQMMFKMAPVILGVLGLGFFTGYFTHKKHIG